MSGGIFLIKENGELVEMAEQAYLSEQLLQDLIATHPSLIPGDLIDYSSPRRWLLISQEMGVPCEENGSDRWAIDHLFLDQDAIPTIVEVKRSSDTRIRREVVGQMLDYASNAIKYWPIDELRAKFESQCKTRGRDSETVLTEFLGAPLDQTDFWARAHGNLQKGRVRLLFIADVIPVELKRIVEFLNEQLKDAEVLAVEIRQYTNSDGKGLKTLVPRVFGQTATLQEQKSNRPSTGKQWDENLFFAELQERVGVDAVQVAKKILGWATPRVSRIYWGHGARSGSYVPILLQNDRDHQLFAVWTYGTVEIYFAYYQNKPPFDSEQKRSDLLAKLNMIPGLSLPADSINRRPGIPLSALNDPKALETFFETYEWFMNEIRKSS